MLPSAPLDSKYLTGFTQKYIKTHKEINKKELGKTKAQKPFLFSGLIKSRACKD